MELPRYDINSDIVFNDEQGSELVLQIYLDDNGDWIRYSDIETLIAEHKLMKEALERLDKFFLQVDKLTVECRSSYHEIWDIIKSTLQQIDKPKQEGVDG